ncbi:MAG: cytochrome c3 family protein [Planctomycetota bacterium]|nr:cytochrome c3 family protein [Planctomycetota bacterium]
MANIFPKWMNALPTAVAILGAGGLVSVAAGYWYFFTPDYWRVGYEPDQPVDYNHQLHAGKLGMDCRYCHTNVEESYHANVPDTSTCMNCHTGAGETAYLNSTLWTAHKANPNLVLLRESYAQGKPIEWRRVHKVPDYAHFPHSVHIKAGVSCYSCHGRVDQQEVVRQVHGQSMGFCLDCHRNPGKHLVAYDDQMLTQTPKITDLAAVQTLLDEPEQRRRGDEIARTKQLMPPQFCGACHY